MAAKLSVHLVITLLVFAALIGSVFVQPAPASAATWYVDKAGTDDPAHGTGPGGAAFLTINYAIGRAGANDAIRIGRGTWTEQVVIDKPLSLIGTAVAPTPTGTFIEAPAEGARTNYTAGDGTVFDYVILAHDSANVTVSTLTAYAVAPRKDGADYYATVVFDSVTGSSGFNSGCVSGAFNNNIANMDIAVWGGSNVTVQESLLVDFITAGLQSSGSVVNVVNNEINGEELSSTCVYIDTATSGLVDANLLFTVETGVWINAGQNIVISNNEIQGTAAFQGVRCQASGPIAIRDNEIYGFEVGIADVGITAGGSIDNNEIYNCLGGIVLNNASSGWTSVTDNFIYDNGRGLYHLCPLEAVSGNLFYHNTTGIEANNDLTAHCNAIMGNTTAGLNIVTDGVFNVINNYWGDNSGPNVDGGGPGTGDVITTGGHTVLVFDPWAAMNLSANPAIIAADGVSLSTLNLDCTRNSDGEVMGCNIPDGLQINFTTTAGTLTSATAPLFAGHAVTTLRSAATVGIATVSSAFQVIPALTVSTANVTFTTGPTVATGTGVYVGPSWFYLTGNLTGLGAADTSATPYIDYWGPAGGTWTLPVMNAIGPFSTPATLQTPPGDMPAGTYTFRAKAQGTESGLWAYGNIETFVFEPPAQPGVNTGTGSHGASLTTITNPGTLQLPNLQVTSARLSASSVATGNPVTVSADVANTGGASGAAVVKVYLNNEIAASQGIKVAGGGTTPITFTVTPSQPGEYSVRVNNVQAGTLNVTGGNNNDIIFAVAFATFLLILLALLVVYMRQRRTAA